MKRPMNHDTRKIQSILKCGDDEARMVERVMRDQYLVLGELNIWQYFAGAREAKIALDTDSELRQLIEAEEFPKGG